jgi:hypothetical protein
MQRMANSLKQGQGGQPLFSRELAAASEELAEEQNRLESLAELYIDKVREAGRAKPPSRSRIMDLLE